MFETDAFVFYAAFDMEEKKPVVIRRTRTSFFNKAGAEAFKREYDLLCRLKIEGLVSPLGVAFTDSGSIMVCRPFKGLLMTDVIRSIHLTGEKREEQGQGGFSGDPVSTMLMFGIAAAGMLGHLHRNGIVHGGIAPEVMVWDSMDRAVTIVDLFSAGNRESKEYNAAKSVLPDTDSVCIPHDQAVDPFDFRSDLYCLGVVFYSILTGIFPFDSADIPAATTSVSHHAVKGMPIPPNEIRSEIPQVLSDIVMKLMALKPEDRYQSTFGLLNDLKKVFNQVRYEGKVDDFSIGDADIPETLTIPPILYGQEKEVQTLLSALDRAADGGMEVVLISGPSGIGKSRIVEEIVFPCRRKKGFFITGRFDRLRLGMPYAPLIEAGKSIMRQILAEEDTRIAQWSKKFKDALGSNLSLMINAIPEIALITGKAPPVKGLSPAESERRFNLAVYKFIGVLAGETGLLVVFLDDLQWMDPASIRLIRTVFSEYPIPNVVLIGTFRPVAGGEPRMLAGLTAAMQTAGIDPVFIEVQPLSLKHTRRMIADTLFLPAAQVEQFAEAVHKSTGGNPLHVIQTIKSLYEEGLIRYNGRWILETGAIEGAHHTGSLMALMTDRMEKLPPDVSAVLRVASSVGSGFDPGFLARACSMDLEAVQRLISVAEKEGFVVSVDGGMQFAHDRIRDAFYEMTGGQRRARTHYRIGKILLSDPDSRTSSSQVFEIVYHLNIAEFVIKDPKERIGLARLNLKAGLQAKTSSAYEAARKFMETGLALLGQDAWSAQYDLTLLFHGELCELAYLTGDTAEADIHYEQVLTRAKTPADRVRALEVKIVMYTTGNRPSEAMAIGVEALRMLGLRLPKRPGMAHVLWTLLKTKIVLHGLSVGDLAGLSELSDPKKLVISRILMRCTEPAYVTSPNYLVLVILNMIIHTIKNGNSRYAIFAYAAYGAILGGVLGDYEKGREYEDLALELMEKYEADELKAKVYSIMGGALHFWTAPVKEALKYLLESYTAGLESGDHSFAAYGITCYMYTLFFIGTPLEKTIEAFDSFLPGLEKLHQKSCLQEYLLWFDFVSGLAGEKGMIPDKAGKSDIVEQWRNANDLNRLCIHEIGLMISAYLSGRIGDALESGQRAEKMLDAVMGQVFVSQHYFYQSLALVAAVFRAGGRLSRRNRKRLCTGMKKLKKWAAHAPENYRHQYLFVSAGMAAVTKDLQQAAILFESSVSIASENGFIHDEAMVAELAGLFWLSIDDVETGRNYISRSFRAYLKWGARPKAARMEKTFPFLTAL